MAAALIFRLIFGRGIKSSVLLDVRFVSGRKVNASGGDRGKITQKLRPAGAREEILTPIGRACQGNFQNIFGEFWN